MYSLSRLNPLNFSPWPGQPHRSIRCQLYPLLRPIHIQNPHPNPVPHKHVLLRVSPLRLPKHGMVHKVQKPTHHGAQLDVRPVVCDASDLTPQFVVDLDLVQLYPIVLLLAHVVFVQHVFLLQHLLREHGELQLLQLRVEPDDPDLHLVTRAQEVARVVDELVPRDLAHVEEAVDLRADVHVRAEAGERDHLSGKSLSWSNLRQPPP
mmetsp:Transcript_22156/g.47637  ORF Transcript_22156/g.47637 Transcript_22156/m.47637 type:complete len:207 (-) Transcript_22156:524-1144(-)